MVERKANGLCYFCDEPFTQSHSLTHKKLHTHVVETNDCDDEVSTLDSDTQAKEVDTKEPQISMNALTGVANFRTMGITGYHKKKPLHVSIDSGSTHNFLNNNVAKKFGCKIVRLDPLNVIVANGTKLHISSVVKDFSWTIQHTTFIYMLLIHLGCCDFVPGIEWLVTLGNITWNFDKLTMEFMVQGRRHLLQGSSSNSLRTIKGSK